MIRSIGVILLTLALAACAGGSQYSSQRANQPRYISVTPGATPVAQPVVLFATGPIFDACQRGGRKAASRQRCGCVQWVADQELSPAQQRRGAGYFSDQGALQEVRQSSAPSNERFWKAWKAYGQTAAQTCQSS